MISTTPEAASCKMPSWPCDIDTRSTKSRASSHRPPSPCQMPSWPCDIDGPFSQNTASQQFITLAHLALDRQEYLDSLIPPSSEEIIRIAGLQAVKEAQIKRRNRIHRRAVSEASLQRYQHQTFLPIQDSRASEQHDGHGLSHHSALSSSLRPGPAAISSKHNRSKSATTVHSHVSGLPEQPKPMDASTRWTQAIREARFRLLTAPRSRSGFAPDMAQAPPPGFVLDETDTDLLAALHPKPLTARQRWKKAIAVACRAGFDPYAAAASDMNDHSDDTEDYSSEMEYISSATSIHSKSDSAYHSDHDSEHQSSKHAKAQHEHQKQKEEAKIINELYLLELVDTKHRYGINLFLYHQEWKKSPTTENFFFWLDFGAGRFLDLGLNNGDGCSREKLEREQIRYLSFEEQELYRVVVGSGGRLCWAKNGVPVDTDGLRWRDSLVGIVPLDDSAPEWEPTIRGVEGNKMASSGHLGDWFSSACSSGENSRVGSSWSSGNSTLSTCLSLSSGGVVPPDHAAAEEEEGGQLETRHRRPDIRQDVDVGKKPRNRSASSSKGLNKLKYGNSPASYLLDKFLRQQWGSKPWIFVADSAGRLYIGIKDSGSFQHTSFVRGSRVSAAGMISVKEGKVTGLSPLSGHYRPPTKNFRRFVRGLREMGVYLGGGEGHSHHSDGTTRGGKGARFGEEIRLCYGHDYWLLRGFEIYSGFRSRLFGCDDDHGREEASRKQSKGRLLSMKSMASLIDKAERTVVGKASIDEEWRAKV
ncbi:hypothetical protein QBC37DRAFT_3912 [Rhypophila decipiens]|uniref:Uncharacterized protein n=1 Tax=Rhypophila decipiens TaxID=261697 RepID=A0AAN6YJ37_9PEZI|nr:hypothetical protein QBC37DRAFT_3912 [Rhypophila decipiens]